MRFFCSICKKEVPELRTPGDEENRNFVCIACQKISFQEIDKSLEELRQILERLKQY